jgi:hypothetical protein
MLRELPSVLRDSLTTHPHPRLGLRQHRVIQAERGTIACFMQQQLEDGEVGSFGQDVGGEEARTCEGAGAQLKARPSCGARASYQTAPGMTAGPSMRAQVPVRPPGSRRIGNSPDVSARAARERTVTGTTSEPARPAVAATTNSRRDSAESWAVRGRGEIAGGYPYRRCGRCERCGKFEGCEVPFAASRACKDAKKHRELQKSYNPPTANLLVLLSPHHAMSWQRQLPCSSRDCFPGAYA